MPPADATSTSGPLGIGGVAACQGSNIRTGDVLLVRFGVDSFLRRRYDDPGSLDMSYESPGLAQEDATVEWLWNSHIAAICADNIAVEVTPPRGPLTRLHPALIGLRLGELFDLSALAQAYRQPARTSSSSWRSR
ncbi:MAG: cyclase family protein [Actinomycetota bacterium]|nr:cyclase family protein [Actinomycetota bacterium]